MRKASLSSILPRSVGKPSVMFLRLPPKKLTSTRLPGMVPGTSLKTKQAAASSCKASSDTMPISCCHERPLTSLTSPSLRASSSHWRRSSYGKCGATLERAAPSKTLAGGSDGMLIGPVGESIKFLRLDQNDGSPLPPNYAARSPPKRYLPLRQGNRYLLAS